MNIFEKLTDFKAASRVSVIRLHGSIGPASRSALNDAMLARPIERAFRRKPSAVVLQINSPGGSPVQSSLIAAHIRRLADEKDVPVIAFIEDVAASGGYWLACAADEIYADRNSIVGSIGVIMSGFGFSELIAKHGVERRVYTSGENKSQLDPFRPENPEDVARIKAIGGDIHQAFIDHVKNARGDKLADDPALFTGEFWTGEKAFERGLIDGIGHLVPMMKERFGKKTRFRVFGAKKPLMSRLGARIFGDVIAGVEEKSLWARFGL